MITNYFVGTDHCKRALENQFIFEVKIGLVVLI